MNILKTMDLLERYNSFSIEKHFEDEYEIRHKHKSYDDNIAVIINSDGEINYYVTGCYKSRTDYIEINMEKLKSLQEFIKGLENLQEELK